ncbi:MAG TPA: hypothetical protein VGC09_12530, partial [Rhodopila sp.]
FPLLLLVATAAAPAAARAEDASKPAPVEPTAVERTNAFRQAYSASFYEFEACGDAVAGRIYRSALTEKLRQCPFAAETKQRFHAWSAAQRRKSSQMIARLVEDHGGLPMRLEGMMRSCHEQMQSLEYRALRGRLDDYASGKAGPETVVTQPCDAAEIAP